MIKSRSTGLAMAGVLTTLLTAGCASQGSDWASLVSASNDPSRLTPSRLEASGLTAMSWGDDWTAVNLLEQAVVKRDAPLYRFNLATAYQRIGKVDEAANIYATLLNTPSDPRFVEVENIAERAEGLPGQRDLADVSRDRLLKIQQGRPLTSVQATGPAVRRPISELLASPTPSAVAQARDLAAHPGSPTS